MIHESQWGMAILSFLFGFVPESLPVFGEFLSHAILQFAIDRWSCNQMDEEGRHLIPGLHGGLVT